MKRFLSFALFAALAAALSAGVHAQTLRWASQGDPQTMDPHSQNESMTNMMNGQVYERLTSRDKQLNIVPGLATSWEQTGPTTWRVKLRQGVRFHDGSPLTADDVVYSVIRGQHANSQINNYASACGEPVKIDEQTVEFRLKAVNPIFLQHLDALWIMNKAWSEKNNVTRPLDFKNKEEILRTIFEERWNAFLQVVEGIAEGSGTAGEKLHALAGLVLYAYRRRPDWVKVLVFEIQRSSRFSEPEQIKAVGRLFQSVARVVRAGQEAGELRSDLDAQVACLAYIGALETMITSQVLGVMRLPEEPDASDDRTVRAVVELFLGGLRAEGSR